MKQMIFFGLALMLSGLVDARDLSDSDDIKLSILERKQWRHGARDCESNTDPAVEVYRYSASSYILRQNKCLSYEAPFIYLLFGEKKVLMLDTGATENAEDFPVFETVFNLIKAQPGEKMRQLLVIHSHAHGDHTAADIQFANRDNVTLIGAEEKSMRTYFDFKTRPEGTAAVDLGDRILTIIATPGHQEEAISVYDPETGWLLTGDTLYPGLVYVKHWQTYKDSIARLRRFSDTHQVSAILGAHLEMTKQLGEYYDIGTTYQPNEASLVLRPKTLLALDARLKDLDKPEQVNLGEFIIMPMNGLQKTLSNIARWLLQ